MTQAIGGRPVITSNFFNVRTIQKRFKMITNKKGKLSFLKYSLGVFIALVITLMFACENKLNDTKSANEQKLVRSESESQEISSNMEKEQATEDNEPAFIVTEVQASFHGGDLNAFRNWVQKNLQYPQIAAEKGISGKVFIEFAVNSKGDVVDIKVLRGVDPMLDNESIRVIKSSPKWTPAKQGGKIVKQKFVIPLQFTLQ